MTERVEAPAMQEAIIGDQLWAGHFLGQIAGRIRTLTAAALDPLGITPPMLRALEIIAVDQPLTQVQLGARAQMDRTTIVHVLDCFETLGFARRTRSTADRRSHALTLTEKGKVALVQARQLARDVEDDILSPLSPDQRRTLMDLLQIIHTPINCPQE